MSIGKKVKGWADKLGKMEKGHADKAWFAKHGLPKSKYGPMDHEAKESKKHEVAEKMKGESFLKKRANEYYTKRYLRGELSEKEKSGWKNLYKMGSKNKGPEETKKALKFASRSK